MPEGFFNQQQIANHKQIRLAPHCGACGLYKTCKSPKMKPSGRGERKILVVGEAPGSDEDDRGLQFVGKTGQHLEEALHRVGIDFRRDCWITNTLICRPPNNETPTDAQVGYCLPNLTRTMRDLKPEIVVPVGGAAIHAVLGGLWRESMGAVGSWVGWRIPDRVSNHWVTPVWHPSYLQRNHDDALEMTWRKHLKAITRLTGRPYGTAGAEDLSKQVELVTAKQAARRIAAMLMLGPLLTAFDYETTHLKPESEGARIVCASLSWEGKQTIAFPWVEPAISAMKEFLVSDSPKVASHLKFEHRWSQCKLGVRVRNWAWDTMEAAHVLDSRPGITGLKFQALVNLGFPVYDQKIRPMLDAGPSGANRIHLVPKEDLYRYCGLDSLLEVRIAMIQAAKLGIKL
jgi:uracil-DNA glycosylase family 4